MRYYSTTIRPIPEKHIDWILDLADIYSDSIDSYVSSFTHNTCSLTLESPDIVILNQFITYIGAKLHTLEYISTCVRESQGIHYWLAYLKRSISLVSSKIVHRLFKHSIT